MRERSRTELAHAITTGSHRESYVWFLKQTALRTIGLEYADYSEHVNRMIVKQQFELVKRLKEFRVK